MKKSLLNSVKEIDQSMLKMQLGAYQNAIEMRLDKMQEEQFPSRFWKKDPELWKKDPLTKEISNSMGWLNVVEKMLQALPLLEQFKADIKEAGFSHVILMGMGGSSLAPLVFQRSYSKDINNLPLTILDTTDPITIKAIEKKAPLENTLFIVAGKSGTTSETTAFYDYFYDKMKLLKVDRAGENFVAITDPGTRLLKLAEEQNFRHIFLNFADIGGRYSALSYFGIVPAVLLEINVRKLLERSLKMVCNCAPYIPIHHNPGFLMGGVIGELAKQGRNKLTFLMSPSLSPLTIWLEQLIAESTGKEGVGILPVDGNPLGEPNMYGEDRVFVYVSFSNETEELIEDKLKELANAGHPVITVYLEDLLDLGQEFFRWEVATATAGAILGINPFDQPNVQESKDITNSLLKQLQEQGHLPVEAPVFTEGPLRYYSSENVEKGELLLEEFFGKARPGDYIAIQAYLTESPEIEKALQDISLYLNERLRLPVTIGYGPRYLHSTGQYHKGGPATGLFLQLTTEDCDDVPIPGHSYTFGVFKKAQALGDLKALRNHKRKVISINLGRNTVKGLIVLKQKIEEAQIEYLMNVHW